MLTLGSGYSTSQGQKKVWPTLLLSFLPPEGCYALLPVSQGHTDGWVWGTLLLLLAGHSLHGWDGLAPDRAFWAVDLCVLA